MNEVVQGRGSGRPGRSRGTFRETSMLTLVALRVFHVGDDAGDRRRAQAAQRRHARHYTVVRDPIVPLRWIQVCPNVSNARYYIDFYFLVTHCSKIALRQFKPNRTESHSLVLHFLKIVTRHDVKQSQCCKSDCYNFS